MNKEQKRKLEVATLKIQAILLEANAFIYADHIKECLIISDNEIDDVEIEFTQFETED